LNEASEFGFFFASATEEFRMFWIFIIMWCMLIVTINCYLSSFSFLWDIVLL
jgi:hypothetical protein